MGRLDCSFLGRPLDKLGKRYLLHAAEIQICRLNMFISDTGFTAYASYIRVEVAHTHPVLLRQLIARIFQCKRIHVSVRLL